MKHSIVKIVIIKNISSVVLPVLFNYCAEPAVLSLCLPGATTQVVN